MGAFGSKRDVKEIIREQKRMVDRSIRQLERERKGLERQEVKLKNDIKKMAKQNQMKPVRVMAKDLVRMRKSQEKFINLMAQLRGLSLQMTEMQSQATLQRSMHSCARSMSVLNAQMNLPMLQRVMREFAKQSEQMEFKQEMLEDTMDAAMEDEEDEIAEDMIVNQVLDEIGISAAEELVDAPSKVPYAAWRVPQRAEAVEEKTDDELEARLNNLSRR
ncbi:MAG: hypothetical protein MHM6MM_001588 [Cercozoa sp. M6MM]